MGEGNIEAYGMLMATLAPIIVIVAVAGALGGVVTALLFKLVGKLNK